MIANKCQREVMSRWQRDIDAYNPLHAPRAMLTDWEAWMRFHYLPLQAQICFMRATDFPEAYRMLDGERDPEEIIRSVKHGLYAANFGGGQVDIVSGKFVFSAAEAFMIEDGRITCPVKGATLIGSGPDVLKRVSMIGNDMRLDPGVGTCGKDGQSVPVGVGQPTLRVDGLTVGGTV
jgi:hypothetical protein